MRVPDAVFCLSRIQDAAGPTIATVDVLLSMATHWLVNPRCHLIECLVKDNKDKLISELTAIFSRGTGGAMTVF